jgi:hypothetical protein
MSGLEIFGAVMAAVGAFNTGRQLVSESQKEAQAKTVDEAISKLKILWQSSNDGNGT